MYQPDLVSVVIPTYNHADFIREAVESVLSQSYENLELIIADDASTDSTSHILKEHYGKNPRVKLLLSETNQGISSNYNKAFDACRGEFVAFLSGDDLMLSGKIQKQVDFLKSNTDYVLVHHDAEIFESKSGIKKALLSDAGEIPTHPLDWAMPVDWFYLRKRSGVIPSACLARADYYLSARYDQRLKYKHELLFTIEDYYANPKGKWHVIPEVLIRYRVHESNFSMKDTNRFLINDEGLKMCELALIKCPNLSRRIIEFRNYFIFQRLLFDWYGKEEHAKYLLEFRAQAGFFRYLYLAVSRLLLKLKLYWPSIKILRFLRAC